jgi:hypothetical protein
MDAGSRSDEDTSRVGRYDFDRLEVTVDFHNKEHERLAGERYELLAELVDREHRVSTLENRLETEQGKRAIALEGVDKILARLEQLQASAMTAAKAGS